MSEAERGAGAAAPDAGAGAVPVAVASGPLALLRQRARVVTTVILAVLLVALTTVTVIDVVGRYLFNHPLPGGTELTELLVMATIFAGLPAICLDDGHVTVDMLVSRLEGAPARVHLAAVRLIVAAVLALVAWQLWVQGLRLASYTQTKVLHA